MSKLDKHMRRDGVKWFFVLLAFLLIGVILCGILTDWFSDWNKFGLFDRFLEKDEQTELSVDPSGETQPFEELGGMVIDEHADGEGISLMSVRIPVSLYEAYGVSSLAETAQTVIATVSPYNEATNTAVEWTAEWEDPSSEWATGKSVEEYLTLTPLGEGYVESKTLTVSCMQPFGEKIVITCTSVDNTDAKATVNVHYVQKLTSASLSFGSFGIRLNGNTNCIFEINTEMQGKGGLVTYQLQKNDIFTDSAEESDVTIFLSGQMKDRDTEFVYPWGKEQQYDDILTTGMGVVSILDQTVRFDFSYMTLIDASYLAGNSPNFRQEYYKNSPFLFAKSSSNWKEEDLGKPFAKVTLQFTYDKKEVSYTSNLIYNGYVASVSKVATDKEDLYY